MDVGAVFSSFARGWPSKKPALLAHKADLETEPGFRPYQGQPPHTRAPPCLHSLAWVSSKPWKLAAVWSKEATRGPLEADLQQDLLQTLGLSALHAWLPWVVEAPRRHRTGQGPAGNQAGCSPGRWPLSLPTTEGQQTAPHPRASALGVC